MDNYKTIEQKLKTLTPFRGNTMWSHLESNGRFTVWSYSTPIATAWRAEDGTIVITQFDRNKYSVTTSKQQNIIRRAWGIK